jgi:hypothetical protein
MIETKKFLTHDEVLEILSQQAREGSVTAAAALERALRACAKGQDEVYETIDRILTRGRDDERAAGNGGRVARPLSACA